MTNTVANTSAVVRATVHSNLMLECLKEDPLIDGLYRNVTDFGDGNSLQIPTLGSVTIHDIQSGQPVPKSQLSTGTIGLQITNYKGVMTAISDDLKEDGYKAAAVEAALVPSSLTALRESFETDLLATAVSPVNGIIKLNDANAYNGFDHRYIASGANNTLSVEDFVYAKLAMKKANCPESGWVAIVDDVCEASLNMIANIVGGDANPRFEGIVNTGFAKNRRFVRNIMGFDVYTSNKLPTIDTESIVASAGSPGAATITNGVNNIFMCLADDTAKPFMGAQRRMPKVEGARNASLQQDEFYTTSRWGFAPQRGETLISIITSAVHYK